MSNYFLQTYTYDPWWNLAVEKYLAGWIKPEDVLLYLWQNENTVVIGRNQNALRECRASSLEKDGGYLARRETGGGAVYHDLGNLCFTFIAGHERYDLQRQLGIVQEACRCFGIETHFSGRNDIITENGFKFSGNAFSSGTACRVHHGTLMIDVDKNKMTQYLKPSAAKLKSKGIASVRARVCNLRELNESITTERMRQKLKKCYEKEYGAVVGLQMEELPCSDIQEIYERYSSWDWRYGKSPDCEVQYSRKFDWGEIEILEKLSEMRIQEAEVYSDALEVEFPGLLKQFLAGKRYDMQDVDVETADVTPEQRKKLREVILWLAEICE